MEWTRHPILAILCEILKKDPIRLQKTLNALSLVALVGRVYEVMPKYDALAPKWILTSTGE